MRAAQFQILVVLAMCSMAMADVLRVPLSINKVHPGASNFQLRDDLGQETNVVDLDALQREVNKINRRYGGNVVQHDDEELSKRWINAEHLAHDHDMMDEEDSLAAAFDNTANVFKNTVSFHTPSKDSGAKVQLQKGAMSGSHLGHSNGKKLEQSVKGETGTASASAPLKVKMSGGNDYEFVSKIKIGTPAQTFHINPDTGSSDVWVISAKCTSSNCGGASRKKFNRKESSTYKPLHKDFMLQYGIGAVRGRFMRDAVQIGSLKVSNQTLGLASHVSSDWKQDAGSGVMGLGFRSITSAGQRTLLQNIALQNKLSKHVVSFAFGRSKSGTAARSEMLIGDIDAKQYKGDLKYYKLSKVGYWQTSAKSFGSHGHPGVASQDIILDTGTSLIAASSKQAAAFWKGVSGAQRSQDGSYYTFPCGQKINAALTMPDGTVYPINEQDINLGQESQGSDKCVGTVLVSNTPGPIIMGLSMLKNVYQVYDFTAGNERIGLASYSF